MKKQNSRKFLKDKSLHKIIQNLDFNLKAQISLLNNYKSLDKSHKESLYQLVLEELRYVDSIIDLCSKYKLPASIIDAYAYCSQGRKRNELLKALKLSPQLIVNPKKK